jgi:Predicted O-linked N-acetylglucosamine transferase, SPINDLY family
MASRIHGIPKKKPVQIQSSQHVQLKLQQAVGLHQSGRLTEALAAYQEILKIQPKHFDSLHLSGVVAMQTGQHALGVKLIDEAIKINPGVAFAYNNRGKALKDLGRLEEALASYDKALALKPDYAEAHGNRGNVLQELRRLDEALASHDQALAIKSDYAEAHNNRGNALLSLRRWDEAITSYDRAVLLKPGYADAYYNRGNALKELRRPEEALASYDKALALKPDFAEAHGNRGNALVDLQRLDAAVDSYRRALTLRPASEFMFGSYLHTKMRVCEWNSLVDELHRYGGGIVEGQKITAPFPLLGLLDVPELQQKAAKIFTEARYPRSHALGPFKGRAPDGKIRVAYYSADFHDHATAYLMAELLERHDPRSFEIYGFSFGPERQDGMRQRLSSAFYKFIDVRNKTDTEVARLSRELGMDIAVDLKGYTQDARPGMFALGCAPVQVNYLGYPGTMGADYMDYVIADKFVLPVECQGFFEEKAVYLPHSYQVNDSRRRVSERIFTRQELGLQEGGFVFCCFNNNYKILPQTFDSWMRILKAVEGSVLWLLEDNATAAKNLRREAQARGVDGQRLVFAQRMPLDEHLARHRLADLFLDTLPCNAHTTASDALWAGLPLLTCKGNTFAGRVAGSLLNAMDLPELVTSTPQDYESVAIELATNPGALCELRNRLEKNRATSPLFDAGLYARHLEAAYRAMHDRYQAGLPAAVIDLAS